MKLEIVNLKNEWRWILAICTLAFVGCIFADSKQAIALGWLSLASGWLFILWVGYYGRLARRLRGGYPADEDSVGLHRYCVACMTTMILVGVIGIEVGVRKYGEAWGNPWFLLFHLSLVSCMVVSYVFARIIHTGLGYRRKHLRAVSAFVVFYTAALITGTMLIYELFPSLLGNGRSL
ncbi:MAG: hypothetical protein K9M10_01485 [Candidatus Pacebacteria bacterium]|nr:hypothetical protein [Candidatus Paceibacterota bacterium]MCF7857136.1 hypothetical protein [Candidatus Paceibacterota bacterium]